MGEFKIIFFGTPDFAVNSLNAINSKFKVDYVVTTPDKRSGRGQKIQESEIKKYAINNNISFLQPDDLKDSIFIEKIKDIKPDLMIVVAFKKLPSELISIPKFGTINLHASLLPEYRGAAPINWCIINGEAKTGVTTFFINEDIDKGDILLQKDIKINDDDDFESLYLKLSNLGAELLINTIEGVKTKKIKSFKQEKNNKYNLAPKLTSENTRIDWNLSVQKIISKIKGLSPRPGAWTMIKNGDDEIRMKILKAKEKMDYNSNKKNGNIVTENGELLIFSSDRKGGYGGFDLWMSKRLPNGNWGTPINMGPNINTEFDEAFPKFSHDQSFLTFSSNGLKGLGGYDLFKTEFSEDLKIWTKPKNLGHPINSAYDDNTITFVKNGRYAYKSDIRKDSHGMRDIYRLTFNDVLPIYTVVKSSVLADTLSNMDEITNSLLNEFETSKKQLDSVKSIGVSDQIIEEYQKTYDFKQQKLDNADPFKNNFVEVTDEKGEIYGQYKTNGSDGKFIMILEPGEYKLAISHDGFDTINTKIKIYDKSNFTPELQKYFYLKPNL